MKIIITLEQAYARQEIIPIRWNGVDLSRTFRLE
jgi:hypothetical protein